MDVGDGRRSRRSATAALLAAPLACAPSGSASRRAANRARAALVEGREAHQPRDDALELLDCRCRSRIRRRCVSMSSSSVSIGATARNSASSGLRSDPLRRFNRVAADVLTAAGAACFSQPRQRIESRTVHRGNSAGHTATRPARSVRRGVPFRQPLQSTASGPAPTRGPAQARLSAPPGDPCAASASPN